MKWCRLSVKVTFCGIHPLHKHIMYPIEDVDAAEKDDKDDQHDQEELERQRNFDEYKDEHKRGEGNRHNRG